MDDFFEQLTVEQAYEILKRAQAYANTLPCPTYFEKEMKEAMERGITDGTAPQGLAIRSQVAVMTLRAIKSVE